MGKKKKRELIKLLNQLLRLTSKRKRKRKKKSLMLNNKDKVHVLGFCKPEYDDSQAVPHNDPEKVDLGDILAAARITINRIPLKENP